MFSMKTVARINPEKEFENAKNILELAATQRLDTNHLNSLDSSINNIMTAARVLMEREERRRGKKTVPKESAPKGRKKGDQRKEVHKLPSERFPNIEVKEELIYPKKAPKCPCCDSIMKDSGLFDVTEKLEVIPKQYYIQRNLRPKFNCGKCHGSIVNTLALPSIVPTSNYGDSLIIDATLSKFCDLIPMERYVQMAFRNGLKGLPPQSLIGQTHHLADFLKCVYVRLKEEVLSAMILLADETPHKMLEGDDTRNWYLWGFFSQVSCYFEAHDTRSGDVAYEFMKLSLAEYLMTDGYPGYGKAVKMIKKEFDREIIEVDCNAHAIRYFKDASTTWVEECMPFLDLYGEIYEIEKHRKGNEDVLTADDQLEFRSNMLPLFKKLKTMCEEAKEEAMPGSGFEGALNYFLNHFEGLTRCTSNVAIPLDNNHSEREMRPPVVGRKTWYGTHSKRGAQTLVIHFSIIASCKVNGINPRNYYPWVVERIHQGEVPLTPFEYSKIKETQ